MSNFGQLTTGYSTGVVVTKSDTTIVFFSALYIGGAGNVAVGLMDGSTTLLFTAVPVGTILPIQGQRVMSTNTTATLIIALN